MNQRKNRITLTYVLEYGVYNEGEILNCSWAVQAEILKEFYNFDFNLQIYWLHILSDEGADKWNDQMQMRIQQLV